MLTMMNPQGDGLHRDSRKEHEEILIAAKARDSDAAVSALRRHMATTVEILRADLLANRPVEAVANS
jgi:DNA-binding GntR family transcriptional regulator